MQRVMATEAEAAREARAKIITSEGERKASVPLKEAAKIISESPIALQLRYMQTLSDISADKNSTIIFPIPIDMSSFGRLTQPAKKTPMYDFINGSEFIKPKKISTDLSSSLFKNTKETFEKEISSKQPQQQNRRLKIKK